MALGVVLLDALAKNWALRRANGWPPKTLIPGVTLTVSLNGGSAFGLGDGSSVLAPVAAPVLSVLTLALCAWLVWLASRPLAHARWAPVAVGLCIGGALGNLADRSLRTIAVWGEVPRAVVVDFIVVGPAGRPFWPAFNLADTALVVGLAWLGYLLLSVARTGD